MPEPTVEELRAELQSLQDTEMSVLPMLEALRGAAVTTGRLVGVDHDRLQRVESLMDGIGDNVKRTAEFSAEQVALARQRETREAKREEREIKKEERDAEKAERLEAAEAEAEAAAALAEAEAATAALLAETEIAAAQADRRFALVSKIVDGVSGFWSENWKMIVALVLLVAGVNGADVLRAFGYMPAAPIAVAAPAPALPAPAVEAAPSPTTDL